MIDNLMIELQDLFRGVFLDRSLELERGHTAADVYGWDSLSHVRLIMEIEQRFRIELPIAEVGGLSDVGALADLIASKLDAAPAGQTNPFQN